MPSSAKPAVLLAIVELGGYPNFTSLYQRCSYQVVMEHAMRKAIAAIKRRQPQVIVTEFNYQSDFRDRTSTLESMLATVQRSAPDAKVIVFYEREYEHQFDRVRQRFPVYAEFSFPIEEPALEACLRRLAAQLDAEDA